MVYMAIQAPKLTGIQLKIINTQTTSTPYKTATNLSQMLMVTAIITPQTTPLVQVTLPGEAIIRKQA
jgi:hypothetical protein